MTADSGDLPVDDEQLDAGNVLTSLFVALGDGSHEMWSRTPSEIRAQFLDLQVAPMTVSQIHALLQPATQQWIEWLAEENGGADNVDWEEATAMYALVCAVIFGATDEDTVSFTPRALAAFVAETRRTR